MLLLDILPEFHVRSFGDYDSPDIYSLSSGIAGAAPDGLLEGICTDGSRLLASFLSRQLAECVQPGHGTHAAHSPGTDNDCIDLSGYSGEKQRYSAVYLLPVLMREVVLVCKGTTILVFTPYFFRKKLGEKTE